MDFTKFTMNELLTRKAAIAKECEAEGADLTKLEEEVRGINAEIERRKAAETQRQQIRSAVASGAGVALEGTPAPAPQTTETRNSEAYVNAYANYIKTGDATECRALLTINASGSVQIPVIVEEIIRTAWERNAITRLVKRTFLKGIVKVGFELSATGAVVHTEGAAAPSEETLVLGVVTLTPASIKKWITVSDEALDLNGEAFLRYIYDELTYRIAKKAADELINAIATASATATSTAVGVPSVTSAPALGTIAAAIGTLSDEATALTVVMNRGTWAVFKAAQYGGNFAVDPFEGLNVEFSDALPAYGTADDGDVYAIVGDFANGAQFNFPNGEEIIIKVDELSLAEKDLVKFVGREYVAIGLVADKSFATIKKPETV